MPLSLGHDQVHQITPAGGRVAFFEFRGVGAERHEFVVVTVDDAEGHARLGRHVDSLDRAERGGLGGQIVGFEAIRRSRLCKAPKGSPVIHGIDPADSRRELRMGDCPGTGPESAAATPQEGRLLRIPARHHLGMQCLGGFHRRRAAERLPRVDAGHGDPRLHELLVHPLLRLVGIGRERGRIKNPGLGSRGVGVALGCQQKSSLSGD